MADEEHRFPCNTCGADMRFAPGEGQLVCDHCGNTEPLRDDGFAHAPIRELDFQAALSGMPEQEIEEKRVSSCPNCGAADRI